MPQLEFERYEVFISTKIHSIVARRCSANTALLHVDMFVYMADTCSEWLFVICFES